MNPTDEPMSGEDREADAFLRSFVADRDWTFAKTMPHIPHEYTVRDWRPQQSEAFTIAARLIQKYGEPRKFGRRTFRYYVIDGWRYWTMGSAPTRTTVINRCADE